MDKECQARHERIRVKEVAAELRCSVSTVWAWVKAGYIPKPYKIGNRFTYWLRSEIEAAANNRQEPN